MKLSLIAVAAVAIAAAPADAQVRCTWTPFSPCPTPEESPRVPLPKLPLDHTPAMPSPMAVLADPFSDYGLAWPSRDCGSCWTWG